MVQKSDFIRELLRRQEEADHEFADAKKKHEDTRKAIRVLLEAEGYVTTSAPEATRIFTAGRDLTLTWGALAGNGPAPTTREFITRALKDADGPMKMSDIVRAVAKLNSSASPDTVRTVLQKMLHAGQVTRHGRGMYALVPVAAEPTEPPAVLDNLLNSLGEVTTP